MIKSSRFERPIRIRRKAWSVLYCFGAFRRVWPGVWIVAVGFGQGEVLLAVGLERFDAFGRYYESTKL